LIGGGKHDDDKNGRMPDLHHPKVGRNDPCPGGSGKKYKKGCGGATVN